MSKQTIGIGAILTLVIGAIFTALHLTDTTVSAVLVVAIVGPAIPLLNALVTTLHASGRVKSIVAVVVAGLTAVVAALADVTGATSVQGIVLVFVGALAAAGGTRLAAGDSIAQVIALKTADKGLGVKGAPELDPDYPKAA